MAFPLYRAEPPANLGAEESAELSVRLAAIAQSGLPLEGGLRALADEVAQPRLARVLCNLAERLERGEKLETAIAAQGSRLPVYLRGLIVAGVRSGRLPIALGQFAALSRRQQDLHRRVLLALTYPALLLGIIAALMVGCHLFLTDQFAQLFRDFGMKLPVITILYFRFSGAVAWTMFGLTIVAVIVPLAAAFLPLAAWFGRVTSWIPVLGTIAHCDRQAQFSHLMAILLAEEIPLPEALHMASIAMQGTMLARQCRTAAAAVEGGMPLDQALALARFPDSLTALVAWGQQKTCLAEAFRAAGEAFEARINSQSTLLKMSVPPLIYLIMVAFVGTTIFATMMPLISLIRNLSGGGFFYHKSPSPGDVSIELLTLASAPVFLLGVLMLMLTRWITGPAPCDGKPVYAIAVRAGGWILLVVGFVVGTYLVVPGLVIVWLAALAVVISIAYSRQAATQQYAMLALVGAAAERSMPLETAFAAYGRERGGWMRRRTAEMADMLSQGSSLPTALEAVPGVLPSEAVPLVCVGYESGSLGLAIDQVITARNLYEPVGQSIVAKIGYICILPAVAVCIVTYIMMNIMPQFAKIFRDFNTKLPDITVWIMAILPRLGILFIFIWLLAVGLLVYSVLCYAGSIHWDLPGMDWLLRRRHRATVLDALALAAQRQRPFGDTLSTLASCYPQQPIARRLWAVYDDVQAGGDNLQCLYRHGLLSETDLGLLQSAQRNGNLAWAARELADSNRRRFIYRTDAMLQVIYPLIIVVYGLLMAVFSAAMILPLADLIGRLAPS